MSDVALGQLVRAAEEGDSGAWNALVDRFAGLVWSVLRAYRLSVADAEDVSQATWLRLVENLGRIREPDAISGWLATTARRESLRVLRRGDRQVSLDVDNGFDLPDDPERTATDRRLLAHERDEALRRAFDGLSAPCRGLLRLLLADPPLSYAEISAALDMPVGSIGPSRARCLERLRRSPEIGRITATSEGS